MGFYRTLQSGFEPPIDRRLRIHYAAAAMMIVAGFSVGAGRAIAAPDDAQNSGTQTPGAQSPAEAPSAGPYAKRVKAPSLAGGTAWINTSAPLEIEQLHGKFVLLDFWTFCCINCMHILPELKKVEHAFRNELVVVGVHSAKFEGEQDAKNITDAVLRYEIQHPVVNDANHEIWNRYRVDTWPTLVLIDPEGYAVWGARGETSATDIEAMIRRGLAYYKRKGILDEKPIKFDLASSHATDAPLRFPGKILADEASGRLFIADSNHNRIVVAGLDGALIDVIGNGKIGLADGDYHKATFNHPQGMALVGAALYVADTENHLIRRVDLDKKQVHTVAGRGVQSRMSWPGLPANTAGLTRAQLPKRYVGKPLGTALNSPWDLWVHDKQLYIAMAGSHQIWKMPLNGAEIGPYAGNGREDIVDGALLPAVPFEEGFSSFAQPSGLTADDKYLYVADSEGSSIRGVPFDATRPVITIIGTAGLPKNRLFTFGDVDGGPGTARLQHALGVALVGRTLYVADTYNNKLKTIDLSSFQVTTLAGTGKPGADDGGAGQATFDEPAGITTAAGKLFVADTNNHLIRVVELGATPRVGTLTITGLQSPASAR